MGKYCKSIEQEAVTVSLGVMSIRWRIDFLITQTAFRIHNRMLLTECFASRLRRWWCEEKCSWWSQCESRPTFRWRKRCPEAKSFRWLRLRQRFDWCCRPGRKRGACLSSFVESRNRSWSPACDQWKGSQSQTVRVFIGSKREKMSLLPQLTIWTSDTELMLTMNMVTAIWTGVLP